MPSPFPGMNPYLENPRFWRAVHARLISTLDAAIREQLPPAFVTTVEERVYLSLTESAYPDALVLQQRGESLAVPTSSGNTLVADAPLIVTEPTEEVSETFLEIRVPGSPEKVVASVEVLSPKNKSRESRGRDTYVAKQQTVLESGTHLVEIDLLRDGAYTLAAPPAELSAIRTTPWDYGVCLHKAGAGRTFCVWLSGVRERLPVFLIPLSGDYADIVIDLNAATQQVYDDGRFDSRIDYAVDPVPPLPPTNARWADALLQTAGRR